jgi:Cys-tRNA synthase (O-phospho-L-seryl-tRNA:Cys-tRNA synthase)
LTFLGGELISEAASELFFFDDGQRQCDACKARWEGITLVFPCFRQYDSNMEEIVFSWDERKHRENRRKHGVSFRRHQQRSPTKTPV